MKILPDSKAQNEGGNCLQKVFTSGNIISPSLLSNNGLLVTAKIYENNYNRRSN